MTSHEVDMTPVEHPLTGPLPAVAHDAAECPTCFAAQRENAAWWQARPADSRLVGLVISREDMPPVRAQRDALARFGVPIDGFRHPAPETMESWEERLARLFGRLETGDVLVVATVHALGRDVSEEIRTIAELRRRGVVVKVVSHVSSDATPGAIVDGSHLTDAEPDALAGD